MKLFHLDEGATTSDIMPMEVKLEIASAAISVQLGPARNEKDWALRENTWSEHRSREAPFLASKI